MGILYTSMKVFHFKEELDSLPLESSRIYAPIHVRIKPTNICNHSCKYCAYGKDNLAIFGKDEVKRVHIPKEKMMEIVDDIIAMDVKAVTFSGGGEPFVYPYFLDVIKKISGSKIKFSSLTNGLLLKGEVAEIFALKGTWVRVSIDGWDDESYSSYRGVKYGEFTAVKKNMENFKKIGGECYLGVSLIVDKHNAPHVYEMLTMLKQIGVDSVKVSPCLVSDRAVDSNNYHKSISGNVKRQVREAIRDLADNSFEIFDAYKELDEKYEKNYTWCPYIQILPIIGADLNVYSCPDKAYNLNTGVVGSIQEQRFNDFWFSDKNQFFKINPSIHCNHHCERNQKNKLVLEYLSVDKEHLEFM